MLLLISFVMKSRPVLSLLFLGVASLADPYQGSGFLSSYPTYGKLSYPTITRYGPPRHGGHGGYRYDYRPVNYAAPPHVQYHGVGPNYGSYPVPTYAGYGQEKKHHNDEGKEERYFFKRKISLIFLLLFWR